MPPRSRAGEAKRFASSRTATIVATAAEAIALAEHLKDPLRIHPVAVVSTAPATNVPYVDVEDLLAQLPVDLPVYVIETGSATMTFANELPPKTQVFGGASRVYPTGTAWMSDPYESPLRFAYSANDAARAVAGLLADVREFLGLPTPSSIHVWTSERVGIPPNSSSAHEIRRVEELTGELERTNRELAKHRAARDQDDADRRRLREELRAARRSADGTQRVDELTLFLDPNEQFRFEVYVAWARRIPAASKDDYPLRNYGIGLEFLTSVEALDGVDRSKVVDVVVEVVTGLDKELAGRDLHPLRVSGAGGSAVVTRDDGATCWRVALQRGAPSARRLHYWRLGESIELSRVDVHDQARA